MAGSGTAGSAGTAAGAAGSAGTVGAGGADTTGLPFEEDFESGTDGWVTAGGTWGTSAFA
jgi:hypothetical protein